MGITRILIADDHDVVRTGLRTILEAQPGWEVVADVSNGREAIDQAVATRPDVAVLDYGLPLVNGIEVTRQIRARVSGIEVLIFTMHDTDGLIREALEAGARGFLLKSDAKRFLIAAVESLASHNPFFTGKVSEALLENYLSKNIPAESLLTSASSKPMVAPCRLHGQIWAVPHPYRKPENWVISLRTYRPRAF
jgi:DNA-binding NarL/FixJ family response regulator